MAKNKPELAGGEKPRINALIYGRQGCGKTTLCATANDHPDLANVLFLNVEGGLLSVSGRGDIKKIDIRNIDVVEEVFWDLVNKDPDYADIQTVVIDSGSELQSLNLAQIVAEAVNSNKNKRDDQDFIQLDDYGKSNAQLKRIFRWYRDAPFNVIITALPQYIFPRGNNQENQEPTDCLPQFTAKLAEAVMGYMDFVWYMYEVDGERKLLTRPKGIYRAKTRGPRFSEAIGQVVDNPTLPALYQKLLESEAPALVNTKTAKVADRK